MSTQFGTVCIPSRLNVYDRLVIFRAIPPTISSVSMSVTTAPLNNGVASSTFLVLTTLLYRFFSDGSRLKRNCFSLYSIKPLDVRRLKKCSCIKVVNEMLVAIAAMEIRMESFRNWARVWFKNCFPFRLQNSCIEWHTEVKKINWTNRSEIGDGYWNIKTNMERNSCVHHSHGLSTREFYPLVSEMWGWWLSLKHLSALMMDIWGEEKM